MLIYMSLPPTENPAEFPNGLNFNPNFYETEGGDGLSQSIADGRYLLKKSPDTATALETFAGGLSTNSITSAQITENLTIGSNLTTGDIVIGNTDTDTIIEGNLKPTNRIITSGLITPTSSSSCALFNTLQTNSIFIGNALQSGYGIQMGSNNGNILMNGKNIQLGTDDTTQTIKCIAKLKANSLDPISIGDTLSVGTNSELVVIGNPTASDIYLGGGTGSNVLISSDLTCNNFRGINFTNNVKLFTDLTSAGINFFTNSTEAYTANTLKIGDISNNIIFKTGSLTSTQVIPENSYDGTIATTKWATDSSTALVGTIFQNILDGGQTYTGTNTYDTSNIDTLNATKISNMPEITAPQTSVVGSGTISTKLGSYFNSGFVNIIYQSSSTPLVYYVAPNSVPAGVYVATMYYTMPDGSGFYRILLEGRETIQTQYQPVSGPGGSILHNANTFSVGNDMTELTSSQVISVVNPHNFLFIRVNTLRTGSKFMRLTLLRIG